jgi:hypothetical protein
MRSDIAGASAASRPSGGKRRCSVNNIPVSARPVSGECGSAASTIA